MSTATIEQDQEQDQAEHTMPSQDDLKAQAKISRPMVAINRESYMGCEARQVEDGFAYRTWGEANRKIDWQWMRTGDFLENFEVFELIDTRPYLDNQIALQNDNRRLKFLLKKAEEIIDLKKKTQRRWTNFLRGLSYPVRKVA
jgi:hypothetical protein